MIGCKSLIGIDPQQIKCIPTAVLAKGLNAHNIPRLLGEDERYLAVLCIPVKGLTVNLLHQLTALRTLFYQDKSKAALVVKSKQSLRRKDVLILTRLRQIIDLYFFVAMQDEVERLPVTDNLLPRQLHTVLVAQSGNNSPLRLLGLLRKFNVQGEASLQLIV